MEKIQNSQKKVRCKNYFTLLFALTLLVIPFIGCGGGGGGGGSTGGGTNPIIPAEPDISVSETQLVFTGVVTNQFSDKIITVRNVGSSDLVIGQIGQANPLADPFSFPTDPITLRDQCSGKTLTNNGSCTIGIQFAPTSTAAFSDSFDIPSNDPDESSLTVTVSGDGNGLNVNINQVFTNNCPEVNLLVSVTDADGNAITTLNGSNFSLFENDIDVGSFTVSNASEPVSVSLIFDYSESFSSALNDALNGAKIFVGNLNLVPSTPVDSDEGSVIKFSTDIINTTEAVAGTLFSSDENILLDSIDAAGPASGQSRFYDAVYQAITEISTRNKIKRAIITYSDGKDAGSTNRLEDVVTYAKAEGVPIFTIGIGNVDENVLLPLAKGTGGQYFPAPTAADLDEIYQQISDLLDGQYVVTYNSASKGGVTNTAKVSVENNNLFGEDSRDFTGCP